MMKRRRSSVIVCGCGKFGSALAMALSKQNYDVTVIDQDETVFQKMNHDFAGFTIQGDASDTTILQAAGIEKCDFIIIATQKDNVNSMIAQIASIIYKVPEIYIRLHDPNIEKLFEDCANIKAIYPTRLSLEEFERLSALTVLEEDAL